MQPIPSWASGDVKYRYYDVDVGKAGDFVGWSTARKTITLNSKRTTIVALILRGGGYGGEWVSNLHTGAGHAHSGFIIPVHEVFADLKNYLAAAQQKGELGVVKLWMGGYSAVRRWRTFWLPGSTESCPDWNGRMSSSTPLRHRWPSARRTTPTCSRTTTTTTTLTAA